MAEPTTEELIRLLRFNGQDRWNGIAEKWEWEPDLVADQTASRLALLSRQYEELRKVLRDIARIPLGKDSHVNLDFAVTIACEALAICRECRLPLNNSVNGCNSCGATLSSALSPSETEKSGVPAEPDGWVRVDAEHPLPDDLTSDDDIWCEYEAKYDSSLPAMSDFVTKYRRTAGERK